MSIPDINEQPTILPGTSSNQTTKQAVGVMKGHTVQDLTGKENSLQLNLPQLEHDNPSHIAYTAKQKKMDPELFALLGELDNPAIFAKTNVEAIEHSQASESEESPPDVEIQADVTDSVPEEIATRVAQLEEMLVDLKPELAHMANNDNDIEIENLLKNLCKKIAYFEQGQDTQARFSKQVESSDNSKIPFTFNLSKRGDGSIKFSITLPGNLPEARIALTGYKIVKMGLRYEIPPFSESSQVTPLTPKDIVLARVHKEQLVPEQKHATTKTRKDGKKIVLKGIQLAKTIMEEIGDEGSKGLVRLPEIRTPYQSRHGELRQELEMDWYNGDFQQLTNRGTLPLAMGGVDKVKFNARDKLGVLIEVANTLQHFHDKRYVHRDIKPANILLEVTNESEIGYKVQGKCQTLI